ncbi:response regulator receiver domain [Chryseobacterium lactis]|uniref:response regulator receiver domain n=1 Tax=Chryseobacterium lactis TaxID=1241981 RepID=UPI0016255976|nr:response regulator receiver domain [Chryseobacterium lactis]
MSSAFFNKSKNIANDFIQNIVFLDDRAYSRDNEHGQGNVNDLDAPEISKIFAKEKKICAVYDPETLNDISDFKQIAIKSDIIILDWFIDISEDIENGNEEDDADEDDVRGRYTLDIISSLINPNNCDRLKIILVYTGEVNLVDISERIGNLSPDLSLNADELRLQIGKTIIFVRAKSNDQEGVDNRFAHLPNLNDKVLKYNELPGFLLNEFTKVTSGLLSNFALLSLHKLRSNTSKILGLYNKDLDHAYLEHKSSIPNQDDAENLILEVFKDSIGDLLHYEKVHKSISKIDVSNWIKERLLNEAKPIKNGEGILVNPVRNLQRDSKFLLDILYSKETDVDKRYVDLLTPLCASKGQAEKYHKYLKTNNMDLFINTSQDAHKESYLTKFATLTHHKNVFLPRGVKPILSLGTVLKSTKKEIYYICIQQKCDSVRIKMNEVRKFLFLPLVESKNGKFNFISNDGTKLQLDSKSYAIRTLKFKSNKDGVVVPKNKRDKFLFEQFYNTRTDEKFEWILDLKDLHAQRIVADYASTLSRVGLNESEWLRKAGTK